MSSVILPLRLIMVTRWAVASSSDLCEVKCQHLVDKSCRLVLTLLRPDALKGTGSPPDGAIAAASTSTARWRATSHEVRASPSG